MNEQPAESSLFLVRVWATVDTPKAWRGKVQHVVSGEARQFFGWTELEAVMLEMLDALQPEAEWSNEEGREQP